MGDLASLNLRDVDVSLIHIWSLDTGSQASLFNGQGFIGGHLDVVCEFTMAGKQSRARCILSNTQERQPNQLGGGQASLPFHSIPSCAQQEQC